MPSRAKPLLRGLFYFLLFAGGLLMLWPAGQSVYGWWSQRALRADWEQSSRQMAKKPPRKATVNQRSKKPAALSKKKPAAHLKNASRASSPAKDVHYAPFPPTRIVIPDINLDAVVLQGLQEGALQRGPGHDPRSVAPGELGNCVLAAHSNIYGAWFGNLDQLWAGSLIELHTPRAVYSYRVLTSSQVSQTDVSVLAPINDGQGHLTLITCTKPASTFRHVVTAVLEE